MSKTTTILLALLWSPPPSQCRDKQVLSLRFKLNILYYLDSGNSLFFLVISSSLILSPAFLYLQRFSVSFEFCNSMQQCYISWLLYLYAPSLVFWDP